MLVHFDHGLNAAVQEDGAEERLEDVTKDLGCFEELDVALIHLEVFSEGVDEVLVSLPLCRFL